MKERMEKAGRGPGAGGGKAVREGAAREELIREEDFRGDRRAFGEDRALFRCDCCGEPVHAGEDCLAVRIPRGEAVRFCAGCAGEEIALADQLDRMRMRYYAGPAEDAEGWESLGR